MNNVMDTLKQRGFIKQIVFEEELYQKLGSDSMVFYIGFDPTADSLHVGHYVQLVAMKHMQDAGHKPIILIGGGTGMIGDPSGRTDMRGMMTRQTIENNCSAFKKQMSKFVKFEGENAAIMVNNADWLLDLNYIEFLRDIGVHFSVNKMLSAECFKQRMEKGLTFFEFNYMLMQSYDFLVLNRKYNCSLQLGGDDQWANILAGADLIRKKEGKPSYAMTFALLTTSEGKKMGKTAKGALWLDKEKTSPYDFYQYFRNVEDLDVEKCLKLLTFLPLSHIEELIRYNDERINKAKEVLAYEVTKQIHGEKEAAAAQVQAKAAFSGDSDKMPVANIKKETGRRIADILCDTGISPSKSEAKRLILGGGVFVGDTQVSDILYEIPENLFNSGEFVIHKGKKVHIKVVVK
ncbi:MAG: tyrosine--tRNA ligase [Clostridia bacterium]|nr:tyrosine--tRNA ligase [Clostridia bacterium]